jgi:hypothetical protein
VRLVRVIGVRVGMCGVVSVVLVDGDFRRRHAGSEHLIRMQVTGSERQAAERTPQIADGQTGIDERAERHVAGDSGKAIEVQHTAHGQPAVIGARA